MYKDKALPIIAEAKIEFCEAINLVDLILVRHDSI
jgi:hypothetical protein